MGLIWSSGCLDCCLDCYLDFNKCICSCINNQVRCINCKIAKEMEEENDKRK